MAREEGSDAVVGFYSLVTSILKPKSLLNVAKFGSRPIPAVYLAMLGVTQEHTKRGLGQALMYDAFKRTALVADNAAAYCLWLQAVDEDTARYYEKLQMARIEPGELEMYIPIDTIKDMIASV